MSTELYRILDTIEHDSSNGAAVLTAWALDAFACFADGVDTGSAQDVMDFERLVKTVHDLRPSMGGIGTQALRVYERVMLLFENQRLPLSQAISETVASYKAENATANRTIAELALEIVGQGRRICTCSYSSTLNRAFEFLRPEAVYLADGMPLGDGVRMAEHLVAKGVSVSLSPDGVLPKVVRGLDAVVFGADQILVDGGVVNRAGSFSLALAAKYFNVPVYVLCHRFKVSGIREKALHIEMQPMSGRDYPVGAHVFSPLFDVTPAGLITGVITERGVADVNEIIALSEEVSRLRRKLNLCTQ